LIEKGEKIFKIKLFRFDFDLVTIVEVDFGFGRLDDFTFFLEEDDDRTLEDDLDEVFLVEDLVFLGDFFFFFFDEEADFLILEIFSFQSSMAVGAVSVTLSCGSHEASSSGHSFQITR